MHPAAQKPRKVAKPSQRLKAPTKVDSLVGALRREFGMPDDDAREIATLVAGLFGEHDELNDDHIDPEVRSILYTLEAKKILSFRREEYTWETGERRRAFYWRVRREALEEPPPTVAEDSRESVYDKLPDNMWSRAPRVDGSS